MAFIRFQNMASKTRCLMDRCVLIKNTNGWKAIIFVISLYLSSKVHGTVFTVCEKTDTDNASIPLNCSSEQMIHVISELYGRRTSEDNCTVVRADSNTKLFDTSNNGLIVNCNGYKKCTEQAACGGHCKGSENALEISYECVEDDNDPCSVLNKTGPLTSLYIHSPGFPDISKTENNCECSVSGQSLNVMMIQQRGQQGVLQITTTGANKNNITWTSNFNDFNRKIALDARHVIVTYNNHTDRTFWLRISGNITHVTCSNSVTPTETTESTGMMTTPVSSTKMTPSSPSFQTVMTTSSLYSTDVEDSTLSETTFSTDDRRSTDPEDEDTETTANSNNSYTTTDRGRSSEEEDSTLSETTFSKDDRRSAASEDSRSDFILILGTVSGGVFLLIVIIITTACVCRKKRVTKQTRKSESDIQQPSDYNKHNTVSISNQPEIMSSTSNTDMPNPYQGLNDQTGNTHIYDNKVFEEDRGLFLSECMVDNELYHSNTPHCLAYDGGEDDNQELEMVANDLYHTYQAGSEDESCPHVNTNHPLDNTADGDGEEEDEIDSPMFNLYHTLESDVTGESVSPEVFDDVDENVMVTNDLYYSYRNSENMSIPKGPEDREEMIMEENDLYYSRHTSVV